MKSLTGNVQGFLSCVPKKKGKPLKDFQIGSGKVIFRKITLAVLCCINQRGRDVCVCVAGGFPGNFHIPGERPGPPD